MARRRSEHKSQPQLPMNRAALEKRLRELGYAGAHVIATEPLGKDSTSIKGFGYGEPVRVRFRTNDHVESVVLRTVASSAYGHDRRADRVSEVVLAFDTFALLPRHVGALDVGLLAEDGALVSLAEGREPYLLTTYEDGKLYAEDLRDVAERGSATTLDHDRAEALANYLADAHHTRIDDTSVYRRAIRDLVGHGEGTFGIVDGYPANNAVATPDRLQAIEREMVRWRWKLRRFEHRCRATHGDFHPFNILFREGLDMTLLDRSRGGHGDPADDIAALTINFPFFALRFPNGRDALRALWDRFWDRYLSATGDAELLDVIAPFYAWRALVVASPAWYPDLDPHARDALLAFVEQTLASERFDVAGGAPWAV